MKTSIKALEVSIYWQKHVLEQSTDPKQKQRCRAAIARLEAQLNQALTLESPL
jgi:TATA-binding protein-associated factor Taf7